MRFVCVKSAERPVPGMAFRTRDLFVRQKIQTINALRGHLAEFGVVAPKGPAHRGRLKSVLENAENGLPAPVIALSQMRLDQIAVLQLKTDGLEPEIEQQVRRDDVAAGLMPIPGIGPISAAAMMAFAPPPETFAKGRDFSAWMGLPPKRHSCGGKERLGRTSRMGQRDLRRLLITGAPRRHANLHCRAGHGGRPLGQAAPGSRRKPALENAARKTSHARCCRAGQPHGADRLGAYGEGWCLSGSDSGRVKRRLFG